MPGLGLSAGITFFMLTLVVALPIGALLWQGAEFGAANIWATINRDRVWAALWLSFRLSFLDLPFALPTAVAGIALTALYAPNGVLGSLTNQIGWQIAYTQWGIWLALVFVGLPFVTRTVQPVIEEIETEVEEASATLGASRWHTLRHVIAPMLMPAALTGFALSLARAVGEYGSVIFIAGNIPLRTEIAPLLIVIQLEEYNYGAAGAIGLAMLAISFSMLLLINLIQIWSRRRIGHV